MERYFGKTLIDSEWRETNNVLIWFNLCQEPHIWCLPINIFKESVEIKELMKYKSVKICNLKDYTANSHITEVISLNAHLNL